MIRNVFGLIYAGEENHNLRDLVMHRSVAALPVGGRYRAIDFQLSNMVHSGIRNIGIITQKNYKSLMDHLGSGKDWDLSRKNNGLFMLPPYDTSQNTSLYHGICDAIYAKLDYVRRAPQEYCLLTGSYTIYSTTYDEMMRAHIENNADITMLYNLDPPNTDAERFKEVRIETDDSGRVCDIEFDSHIAKSHKLGMDIYLLKKSLLEYLVQSAVARGRYNFVSDMLIPNLHSLRVQAVEHQGYVGRLHSLLSYYDLNMDMLDESVRWDLFHAGAPVYTKIKDEPPARYMATAQVTNSIVSDACEIAGAVHGCVLSRGVTVGRNASLNGVIVMQDSQIQEDCVLENVIIDKYVTIHKGRHLIGAPEFPVTIRKGAVI